MKLPLVRLTLPDLLEQQGGTAPRRVRLDGRDLYYLHAATPFRGGESVKFEIWVDPSVNYLIRKVSAVLVDMRWEIDVLKYVEAAPGIYFPKECIHHMYNKDKMQRRIEVSLDNLGLNKPLPQNTFDLHFPPGRPVVDSIRGVTYTASADEKPIGTPKRIDSTLLVVPPENTQSVTAEEPRSRLAWIIVAAFGIPTVIAIAMIIRRRLRQRVHGIPN